MNKRLSQKIFYFVEEYPEGFAAKKGLFKQKELRLHADKPTWVAIAIGLNFSGVGHFVRSGNRGAGLVVDNLALLHQIENADQAQIVDLLPRGQA